MDNDITCHFRTQFSKFFPQKLKKNSSSLSRLQIMIVALKVLRKVKKTFKSDLIYTIMNMDRI